METGEERRRYGTVIVSRAVARMALQWKGRVACKEDTKKSTGPFRSGRECGGRTVWQRGSGALGPSRAVFGPRMDRRRTDSVT